jgi:hypothetical protein
MYSLSQLRTALADPRWFVREPVRVLTHRFGRRDHYTEGVAVLDEEWDTLVILDACRYDAFESENRIPGRLFRRVSRGTTTSEFVRGNFTGESRLDTVYVDANGHFGALRDEMDAEVYRYLPLYESHRDAAGGRTTRAETVTDVAIEAHERDPDKRLVVHYLQPHRPYIAPGIEGIQHCDHLDETIRVNRLTRDDLWMLYQRNLQYVLGEVERLLSALDGLSVVTADHGELLGERLPYVPVRDYGHNAGLYVPALLEVPWLVVEHDGSRRDVTAGDRAEQVDLDSDAVRRNLENLGYL